MSEPTRLKDDPALAAILRSADDDMPSPASRRALALALGLPAATALTASTATSASAATGSAATAATGTVGTTVIAKTGISLVGKVVIGLVLATGAGVVVRSRIHTGTEPQLKMEPRGVERVPPRAEPPARSVDPATPSVPPAAPRVELAPPRVEHAAPSSLAPKKAARPPRVETAVPAPDAPAPAKRPLAQEVVLVDAAIVALRKGDLAGALRSLDDYEQRFPAGALAPEAAVARIEATFASGDTAKGRALADAFLATHPDSPLAQRVRKLGQ